MRLVITVLILVVLPTALLSLLAGRSMQAREFMLDRRLSQEAMMRLDDVAAQLDRQCSDALAAITQVFRESGLPKEGGSRFADLRVKNAWSADVVMQPFLFLNPWDFLYPEQSLANDLSAASSNSVMGLQLALTRALATGSARNRGRVMLVDDDRLFCFKAVPDYGDLYAGMELNTAGLMRILNRLLMAQSGPFMRFSVLTVDALERGVAETVPGVTVSDNLGMHRESVPSVFPVANRRDGILAVRRLHAPMAHVEIGAVAENIADQRQTYRMQERFMIWGILLLAVVISGSAMILITGALRQVASARRRSEFMAGMSHDLRTPVTAMRMLADSLLAGRVSDESRRREYLESIIGECDRLGDLIERVMFYFRQEQGALRYAKMPVEVDVLAGVVVERFRRQRAGRLRIRLTVEQNLPAVRADVNALEKVLTNLIDNALKYGCPSIGTDEHVAEEGEAHIDVRAESRRWRRRTWVVLTVRDRGQGLAAGEQRRIFNRFYRGQVEQTHAHCGGFGLGLSLVADIVKAHCGRIRAYNAPGGGAVFELWLRAKGGER